jgi:uncharacterized membrane protein
MMNQGTTTQSGDQRVLVASFDTPDGAGSAAKQLQDLEKQGSLDVNNTVLAIKNDRGQVEIKNLEDVSVGDGAKIGAVAGGVIGLLCPPSILASAALGGLLGGVTARLRESKIDEGLFREMAAGMQPGTSMLVTVVAPQWTDEVEFALTGVASRFAWVDMDQFAQPAAQTAGDEGTSPEAV